MSNGDYTELIDAVNTTNEKLDILISKTQQLLLLAVTESEINRACCDQISGGFINRFEPNLIDYDTSPVTEGQTTPPPYPKENLSYGNSARVCNRYLRIRYPKAENNNPCLNKHNQG